MDKTVKDRLFIIVLGVLVLINAGLVFGAAGDSISKSFAAIGNIDAGQIYLDYSKLCDGIIYMLFFINLARVALGNVPMFKESKTVPTILGVMLALAMIVFSNSTGFVLIKDLGPIVLLIIAGVFGAFLYNSLKGFKLDTMLAAGLTMLVVLGLFKVATLAMDKSGISTAHIVLDIVAWVSLLATIFTIIGLVRLINRLKASHVPSATSSKGYDDAKTLLPSGLTDAKNKSENAENITYKLAGKDKPELDLIKEEKQADNLDNYDEIIDAESNKFATQLQDSKNKDLTGEQKEADMLTAVSGYTNNISNTLGQMNNMSQINTAGIAYMKSQILGIEQACSQIVDNQKSMNRNRRETAGKLSDDVMIIKDVLRKIKLIDEGLRYVEKSLTEDISDTVIKKMETKVKSQISELHKLETKLSNIKPKNEGTRQVLREQVAKLQVQVKTNTEKLEAIKPMTNNIKSYIRGLDDTIKEIKKVINDMNDAEKNTLSQNAKNLQFLKNFDKALAVMDTVNTQLKKDMKESVDQSVNVEEIPINVTVDIATVFDNLINIQLLTKDFYETDMIPMINDVKVIVGNTARLNAPIANINSSLTNIQNAYNSIYMAAQTILDEDNIQTKKKIAGISISADTRKKIEEVSRYRESIVRAENQLRTQITNRTMNALDTSQRAMQDEIQKIGNEIQNVKDSEQKVLKELTKALDTILKNKNRVDKTFKGQAQNFNNQMAQATQKINETRANI